MVSLTQAQVLAIQRGVIVGAALGLLLGFVTSNIGERGLECAIGRIVLYTLVGAILGAGVGLLAREGFERFAPQLLSQNRSNGALFVETQV